MVGVDKSEGNTAARLPLAFDIMSDRACVLGSRKAEVAGCLSELVKVLASVVENTCGPGWNKPGSRIRRVRGKN